MQQVLMKEHIFPVHIEAMTPAEYNELSVNYSFAQSPFGDLIVASTSKGICYMAFYDAGQNPFDNLKQMFPKATFLPKSDAMQQKVLAVFGTDSPNLSELKLHLKGTAFQLNVWKTLLQIPIGTLSTYGDIAIKIGNPKASRAVGTAIGRNPIAVLIPCHRVIQASGQIGGYMWGSAKKIALIDWEAAKNRINIL